jgi:molybdopterin-guanine dinucleotide biosynthesis protein A
MGSDKALLDVGGEPLVLRVVRRLAEAAAPVLLAPGTPGRFGDLGMPEVADTSPGCGPLGGIVAGLEAAPRPLVAVVAVDMPNCSPEVLRLLARLCIEGDWDAAVPVTASGAQPLHAVYSRRRALPSLRSALVDGRLAMRHALADMRVALVGREVWGAADPDGRFAANLNNPADLALLA